METKSRKRHDESFKREAVRLVLEEGRTPASVERDLGIRGSLLYKWVRLFEKNPQQPFPGKGHLSAQDSHRALQNVPGNVHFKVYHPGV